MKSMGKKGRRVLMGDLETGTYNGLENRIQLFDGKFTTGFRIVEFKIAPTGPTNPLEIISKISTEPKSNLAEWRWRDVKELAWASWNAPTNSRHTLYVNIRDENMVVEDLWISAYTPGEGTTLNYEITLEKYEFPAWTGAGVLVENLSQAGPQ
tara:strand:- start:89 stop:547 length:459 start_codon:yes stop_codon:yes gene_type:complete